MFYNTEILTKRKGGFGVYWLAATIGLKAGLRKISKKELLGCDINKACNKIISPDEPLALRLSSNLLIGVARVFKEQYVTFEKDVTSVNAALGRAFAHMRAATSVDLPTHAAHAGAAAAPTTINLARDPDAAPELGLGLGGMLNQAWDEGIDWAAWERGAVGGRRAGDEGEGSELDFSSGVENSQVTGASSQRRAAHQARLEDITLQGPHLGDVGMYEGEHGLGGEELYPGEEFAFLEGEGLLEGDEQLDRAMREGAHRSEREGTIQSQLDPGGEGDFFAGQEFGDLGLAAEGRLPSAEGEAAMEIEGEAAQHERTPELKETQTATADQEEDIPPTKRARGLRKAKPVQFDAVIMLSDEQLRAMRLSYPERMEVERQKLVAANEAREEQQRAYDLAVGAQDIFAAPEIAELWRAGLRDPAQLARPTRSRKRKRQPTPTPGGEEVEEGRTRGEEDEPEISRGQEQDLGGEDLFFDQGGDYGGQGVELGRGEEEGVEEGRGDGFGSQRPSLPWNVEAERAASELGYQASAVGSQRVSLAGYGSQRASRAGSMVPSVHPSATPARSLGVGGEGLEFEGFQPGEGGPELGASQKSSRSFPNGTQDSQAARATLERESVNFLAYAKRHQPEGADELLFSDIVPVASSSESLAAQALYHTLTLATKRLIAVEQQESFGEIHIKFIDEE